MTRNSKRPLAVIAIAFVALSLSAMDSSAQTTFRACRVPDVGAIYMIGVSGTPSACLDAAHVEFSWTEGGVPADGSIATAQLADGAVTQAKLDPGITLGVGPGDIGTTELADGAVTQAKLDPGITLGVGPGDIGTPELADNAVTSLKIADGTIIGADMVGGTVGTAELALGAVTTAQIADGAVGTTELALDAVTSAQIADGTIVGADLAANVIGSTEVLDESLTALDIQTDAIGAAEIAAGAVGTSEILDGSIQAADLDPGAIPVELYSVMTYNNGASGTPTLAWALFRNLGSFTQVNSGSAIIARWQSHVEHIGGGFCHWEIRIDGQLADGRGSNGGAVNYGARDDVSVMGRWTGLGTGSHQVDLYFRGSGTTCLENSGNFSKDVLVFERPS